MQRSRIVLVASVGLPPLVIAGLGLAHPPRLTDATAGAWLNLHVALLPLFPLLALAPWLLARRQSRSLGWLAALLGYTFAVCYTALDVLAGIGAGALQLEYGGAGKGALYDRADALAQYGVWAYFLAGLLASALAVRSAGPMAVPGSVLVLLGAWLFIDSHVYWPMGVLALLCLAVGWSTLASVTREGGRPSEVAVAQS